jgi:TolA-binding protein
VVVRATVTIHTEDGERKFSGIAHERENIVDKRSVNATSYIENAETSAIGRALAASGRSGSEYASADELTAALQEAESDLLKTVRQQRERLQEADETEAALKSQISQLRAQITIMKHSKDKQAPVLSIANQKFSALAQVSDQSLPLSAAKGRPTNTTDETLSEPRR